MSWTQEQIDNTLRTVVERSISDPAFRAAALKDASAAIATVTTTPLARDFRVQFVDNAGYDLTVVLPDVPSGVQQLQALSDDEVAGVAGGTIGIFSGACVNFTAGCHTGILTACNPGYTKKPSSPAFCPK